MEWLPQISEAGEGVEFATAGTSLVRSPSSFPGSALVLQLRSFRILEW